MDFGRDRPCLRPRIPVPCILAAGEMGGAPSCRSAAPALVRLRRPQLADQRDAVGGERCIAAPACCNSPTGLSARRRRRRRQQSPRSRAVCRGRRRSWRGLVVAEPDRPGDPGSASIPPHQCDQRLGRRRRSAPRCRRGREKPRRSTAARRAASGLHFGARTARPTSRYFAMSGRITTACGQAAGLEHRHRRARTP